MDKSKILDSELDLTNTPDDNPTPVLTVQIFKESWIALGGVFGGPLACAIMASANFSASGDNVKSILVWMVAVIPYILTMFGLQFPTGFIVCFAIHFLLPFFIINSSFSDKAEKYLKGGGKLASSWLAFGITVICLGFMLAVMGMTIGQFGR
jgi:hypothetical protein